MLNVSRPWGVVVSIGSFKLFSCGELITRICRVENKAGF